MRVFLAIDIDESIKNELNKMINKLKRLGANARWVKPDNAHITIKFFGEISEEEIALIRKEIKEAVFSVFPFNIKIENLGFFPERGKSPRVLWAGISVGKELKDLYTELNKRFSKIGFPEEHREFKPHLTLCRIKNSSGISGLKKGVLENINYVFGNIYVEKIILYKSILTPKGPLYSVIEEFKFGGKEK